MISHNARKRFGQNFLTDRSVIDNIIQAISPKTNEIIVEIGPGLGALTEPLLQLTKKLIVIELDRDLAPKLQQKLSGLGELTVYQADALDFDFSSLATNQDKLRIVGNLPYNISTPLIFHLLTYANDIHDMHFMLQKEVVERMTAPVGTAHYGRLSVMVQYQCQATALFLVPPESFHPKPKVDSAIIRLSPYAELPYPAKNYHLFSTLVREAFNQRRKTLRNCLRAFITPEELESLGLSPLLRPEQLSVRNFMQLEHYLSTK